MPVYATRRCRLAYIRYNISLKRLNVQFSMTVYRVSFHVVVMFGAGVVWPTTKKLRNPNANLSGWG